MQLTSSPHVTKRKTNSGLKSGYTTIIMINRLLMCVSFLVIVKCMMISPFFSYALGIMGWFESEILGIKE